MQIRSVSLLCALALAGCAGAPAPIGGSPEIHVVNADALPPPTRGDIATANVPYLVGPFDKLTIDVFGIKELSMLKVQTDASGRISFPLIGQVDAAGRTPAEIAAAIATRLKTQYVRDPQVTVNLEETVSQLITVSGQVTEPGTYPVVGRMTLMRAVAIAKGTTEFAKMNDVVVFRTVGARQMVALYNLGAIQRGAYVDPQVYANDVVIVGESEARRIFKDVLQSAPLLTAPLIAYLNHN